MKVPIGKKVMFASLIDPLNFRLDRPEGAIALRHDGPTLETDVGRSCRGDRDETELVTPRQEPDINRTTRVAITRG